MNVNVLTFPPRHRGCIDAHARADDTHRRHVMSKEAPPSADNENAQTPPVDTVLYSVHGLRTTVQYSCTVQY